MMIKKINTILLFTLATIIAACSTGETSSTITSYSDVAVTGFTLGTLKLTIKKKYATTTDSTYSAASLPIYIDQVNNKIICVDSLPVETKMSKVPVSISTRNSGTLQYSAGGGDFKTISASDSLDFENEDNNVLRVTSNDGTVKRDYKVFVAAHKQYGDSITIERLCTVDNLKDVTPLQAAWINGTGYVLGKQNSTVAVYASTDMKAWNALTLKDNNGGDVSLSQNTNISEYHEMLTVNDGAKVWYVKGRDQKNLVTIPSFYADEIKAVIGGVYNDTVETAVVDEMYAVAKNGDIWVAKNTEGKLDEWEPDCDGLEGQTGLINNSDWLPYSDFNAIIYDWSDLDKGIGNICLVAKKDPEITTAMSMATIWNKVVDARDSQDWVLLVNPDVNNANHLNAGYNLSVAESKQVFLAVSANDEESPTAMESINYSVDHGVTWRGKNLADLYTKYPTYSKPVRAVVLGDDSGHFYIVAKCEDGTATVYRAYKNSMTWKTAQTLYR